MINVRIQHQEVQKLTPRITVVGVGGAGSNAVNNMIATNLEGVEFVVCNTDAQALEKSLCENKVQLGLGVTSGLGAGAKPDVGRAAAEESTDLVAGYLDGSNMVFITAGMGGGTGTGAAPVIARACRERGILTVGVVTKPFHFEGSHRMRLAEGGLEELQNYVDTLIVIPNQNLFRIANEKITFSAAFQMADGVLQSGVRGVTDLMVRPGLINLDFADIRTAMSEMGKAMMGTGEASGDKRALQAAESAISNPLLDDISMKGARGVIINVTGGYDMTLFEVDEACNRIRDEVDPNANIIFGAALDESMEGTMRVSVVATGIDAVAQTKGKPSWSNASSSAASSAAAAPSRSAGVAAGHGGSAPVAPVSMARPVTAVAASSTGASVSGGWQEETRAQMQAAAPSAPVDMFVAMSGTAGSMAEAAVAAAPQMQVRKASVAEAGVPRAMRHNESFIPPRPVEVEAPQAAYVSPQPQPQQPQSQTYGGYAPAVAPSVPTRSSAAPSSNAPTAQTEARRRIMPSLFERITTHIRGTESEMESLSDGEEGEQSGTAAASGNMGGGAEGLRAPQRAAQERLNIENPSTRKVSADDDLDIPAFLRRQAN